MIHLAAEGTEHSNGTGKSREYAEQPALESGLHRTMTGSIAGFLALLGAPGRSIRIRRLEP
jgi:hypothetical protein